MQKLNGIIEDFIKCIIIGSSISLTMILGVGVISLIIPKFNWQQSLNIVRSRLLIIGPSGMILRSVLILRRRKEKRFLFIDQWKEKYSVFSYKVVLIIISLIIILYGGAIGWIIMNFNIIS